MHIRRTLAGAIALALSTFLAPAAAEAAYDPDVVTPVISAPHVPVQYSAATDTARVTLHYKCTNTAQMESYLLVSYAQPGSAYYVRGYRSDVGGLTPARCTGSWVTTTVTLLRSANALPEESTLRTAPGHLTVEIAQRSVPELGGWYVEQGPGATSESTLRAVHRGR